MYKIIEAINNCNSKQKRCDGLITRGGRDPLYNVIPYMLLIWDESSLKITVHITKIIIN
jgi:hypothetical protein